MYRICLVMFNAFDDTTFLDDNHHTRHALALAIELIAIVYILVTH